MIGTICTLLHYWGSKVRKKSENIFQEYTESSSTSPDYEKKKICKVSNRSAYNCKMSSYNQRSKQRITDHGITDSRILCPLTFLRKSQKIQNSLRKSARVLCFSGEPNCTCSLSGTICLSGKRIYFPPILL